MTRTMKPTEVIVSADVEEHVRKRPFRTCKHEFVELVRMAVHRGFGCPKCGTLIITELVMHAANLNSRTIVQYILKHLQTSVLVVWKKTGKQEELTPEQYKSYRGQGLLDVLRFGSGGEDSEKYYGVYGNAHVNPTAYRYKYDH